MKTALQILGSRRFKRYRHYGFLTKEDLLGEAKYIDKASLILHMKHNFAYYYANLRLDGRNINPNIWNRYYEEIAEMNLAQMEIRANDLLLTGEGSADLNDAKNFA